MKPSPAGHPRVAQRRFSAAAFAPEHTAALVVGVATALALTVLGGVDIWPILLGNAIVALVVMAGACGWGSWPAAWLGFGRRSALQQVCLATALGLGILALLTLALGCAGALSRLVAWVVVVGGIVLGFVRVDRARRATAASLPGGATGRTAEVGVTEVVGPSGRRDTVVLAMVLLTLVVPLAVMLVGASLPPGILWNGEAQAYDALEYHLQCPREYFDAGRIHFLPHNVYASFPQQMEMLYLLLMHLAGGPYVAAMATQFLHGLCGVLAVMALAAWTPAGWARVAVTLVAGSVPWLAYLGCLAYVELGMVALAAVAGGVLAEQMAGGWRAGWRGLLAAGLCAGLAGGCKYTALVLVLAGLMVAWVIVRGIGRRKGALAGAIVIGLGGLVAFAPWLVRNAAFTGNPVYPFAYRWFGGAAWSAEQDEQWRRGHAPGKALQGVGGRLRALVDEVLAARLYGPTLFVLGAGGLGLALTRGGWRRRSGGLREGGAGPANGREGGAERGTAVGPRAAAVFLALWGVLIVAGWAVFTHMPGRFAVPVVVPLALLVGRGAAVMPRWPAMLLVVLAAVGAAANNLKTAGDWAGHNERWAAYGYPLRSLTGRPGLLEDALLVNMVVPSGGRVWLVGQAAPFYVTRKYHYTVVFNRDPWVEMARTARPAEAVDWLRTQAVTHVVFSWPEIRRLRRTYRFAEWVTPEWVQALVGGGLRRVPSPPDAPDTGEEVYEVTAR